MHIARTCSIIVVGLLLVYLTYWLLIMPFIEMSDEWLSEVTFVYSEAIGFSIIILISLATNVFLFLTIYVSTHINGKIHYFVISMLITDILSTITTMPLMIYGETIKGSLDSLKVSLYVEKASVFFSVFSNVSYCSNFAMMCFLRWWKSCFCYHNDDVSLKLSVSLLIISWAYSVTVVIIHIVRFEILWLNYMLEFFIPLLFALGIYCGHFFTQRPSSTNSYAEKNNLTSSCVFVLLVSLLILRMPYFIILLLHNYVLDGSEAIGKVKTITVHLFYLKCCVNIFIFGVCDINYRESYYNLWKSLQRKFICYNSGVQISFRTSTEEVNIIERTDNQHLISR